VIETRSLVKVFRGRRWTVEALRGVDFTAPGIDNGARRAERRGEDDAPEGDIHADTPDVR
jgi:hypothetical protein